MIKISVFNKTNDVLIVNTLFWRASKSILTPH